MENEEKKPVIISRDDHFKLEDVPEPLRALFKARMDAARSGKETSEASKLTFEKDLQFNFQGGPGLFSFMKLLVKASQPASSRLATKPFAMSGTEEPEQKRELNSENPNPGAIKPSSSGWIVWLAAVLLAAFYLFYSGAGFKYLLLLAEFLTRIFN